MTNIFNLENFNDFSEKINIDDLYEKKRIKDLQKLELFKKILNRIHIKIKITSKTSHDKFCWFVIPEIIIGVPRYDQSTCIAYVMDNLSQNGFQVRYFHPNTILISWSNWIPTYVRNELKKKTGIIVDQYGNKIEEENDDDGNEDATDGNHNDLLQNKNDGSQIKNSKKYTPINNYKPSGKLVYSDELMHKLENKL
jgi:hypothetical protein